MSPSKQRRVYRCAICSRDSLFHFYGVQACEGCKQFFRRVVVKQHKFTCTKGQDCDIVGGNRCRGCRLAKCLKCGMDPGMVQLKEEELDRAKEFIGRLKQRQARLQEVQQHREQEMEVEVEPSLTPGENSLATAFRLVHSLMPLERAYQRIWESTRALPSAYTERHEHIQGLLGDSASLLDMADCFPEESCWDKARFMEEMAAKSIFQTDYVKIVAKDWFLCVEAAKAMPHFRRLATSDQIALLQHIMTPMNNLCGSFFSHARGARTLTRRNGLTPMAILEAKKTHWDEKIKHIYSQLNCQTVERIAESGIGQEELILLMAILFANSDANDLSPNARELLYGECVRYMKALFQMLMAKFGHDAGPPKFAETLRILDLCFRAKPLYRAFIINLELFYDRMNTIQVCPKAISFYPKYALQ